MHRILKGLLERGKGGGAVTGRGVETKNVYYSFHSLQQNPQPRTCSVAGTPPSPPLYKKKVKYISLVFTYL